MNSDEATLHAIAYEARRQQAIACDNNAPHVAIRNGDRWHVYQGCCNSWQCSRCGVIRANTEYHRMRQGAQQLHDQGEQLWFVTITARGRDQSAGEAEDKWYKSTTKLLNAYRNVARRSGQSWCYATVTERQRRGHPHAHYLITSVPADTGLCSPGAELSTGVLADGGELWSHWLFQQCQRSGLGTVFDIQPIEDVSSVVSYVAKYLYKSLTNTSFPKNWRRVRYSRNWYRKERHKAEDGFALLSREDWKRLGSLGPNVTTDDLIVFEDEFSYLAPNLKPRKKCV